MEGVVELYTQAVIDHQTAMRISTPQEYVDVRGPWPMYVRGSVAIELRGKPRDITLEDARAVGLVLLGLL